MSSNHIHLEHGKMYDVQNYYRCRTAYAHVDIHCIINKLISHTPVTTEIVRPTFSHANARATNSLVVFGPI